MSQATATAKGSAFDTWTDSELKSYLDSYGVVRVYPVQEAPPPLPCACTNIFLQPVPQGSKTEELRAYARRQYTYFKYGTTTPTETIFAKLGEGVKDSWNWVTSQLGIGVDAAKKQADAAKAKAKEEL